MELSNSRILLTGASGGIGRALARELNRRGARLGLIGRNPATLSELASELAQGAVLVITADLTRAFGRARAVAEMERRFGGIDLLINAAGVMDFTEFASQSPESVERILQTNVLAPMLLTRAVLPAMLARGSGRIVNLGSIFGSIAFAAFSTYSASKFALRGFSEALRRELAGTGVGVTYVAPRAVKTPFNPPALYAMAQHTKMKMDDPKWVANKVVEAVEKGRKDVYLGFPERLFVGINALLPRLVDKALHGQIEILRKFAGAKR